MAKIIKVYKEQLPALRFIGKRYTDSDRGSNKSFSSKWDEWFQNGYFETLEALGEFEGIENGYLGFMRCNGMEFEYWIGMFFAPNTKVPPGFDSFDINAGSVGICWIRGNADDGSIYGLHDECILRLKENGMHECRTEPDGSMCFFERYNCPRFLEKDEAGNVILDYGVYLA